MATNPAFDYGSRDYSNIKADLLRRASVVAPEWTDRDPSDFGMLLVDLWAYMGDIVHYYIDRASKEAFIQTATQKESVLAFANLYGYTPNYRTSAEATVYVANNGSASLTIPTNTKFVALHNDVYYYFYSSSSASVPAGQLSEVTVVEGRRTENEVLTSSASGFPNQKYIVRDGDVVPNTIDVYVYEEGNSRQWLRYRTLADMPVGAPGYTINVNPEGVVEIWFGDRSSGRIPPAGSTITVSYTSSSGYLGNVPENAIFDFESSVPEALRVMGSSPALGGGDGEEVESIRNALQSVVRSQDRAVTLQDYRDIALRVNGVYDAIASYYLNVTEDDPPVMLPTITIYPLPYVSNYLEFQDFEIPVPSEMIDNIQEILSEKGMVGVYTDVAPSIEVCAVNVSFDLTVNKRYVSAWVRADVENVLDNFFTFSNVRFGHEVTRGQLYKAILNVEGVDGCNITVLEMRDIEDTLIPEGELPAEALIRKGVYTITTIGGMSTSI